MSDITLEDIDCVEWVIREECSFCGHIFEETVDAFEYDSLEEGAVAVMNDAGWGIGEDDNQVGIACPCCVETQKESEDNG